MATPSIDVRSHFAEHSVGYSSPGSTIVKIAIACLAAILLCICIALGAYFFMPVNSAWADDYRGYSSTLANDDPLRRTLDSMLADGELSIWEISRIHCGETRGCQLNNSAEVLLSPQSAELFAQSVLASLKHRNSTGE